MLQDMHWQPRIVGRFFSKFGGRHKRPMSSPPAQMQSNSTTSPGNAGASTTHNIPKAPAIHSVEGPCMCGHEPWSASRPTSNRAASMEQLSPTPSIASSSKEEMYRPEVFQTIEETIDKFTSELRKLSLDIWEHPEIGYEERFAHDALTSYLGEKGWSVTSHYLGLETAWRADYTRGTGGRVIGVNSEMDALPNLGHACGHNLIAVSGVAVALALREAIDKYDISARIILLGTPAEEFSGGKIKLLDRGAYDEMDICVMSHPGPGKLNSALIAPWLALQNLEVEFFGHSAHASYSPWEAQNALDAAFLAYSGVSVLRQQLKPTSRVHGIVTGKDWEPNVIPDYAKMRWIVRAPTFAEVESLSTRVKACFEAAALATSCEVKIKLGEAYHDVRQNDALGYEFSRVSKQHLAVVVETSNSSIPASTDFGLVSYRFPSLQPVIAVPSEPNGGNHTPQFTQSARSPEAHKACMKASKALAMTAFRVADDHAFYQHVRQVFQNSHPPHSTNP